MKQDADWRDREIDRLESALGYSEQQSLIEMDRGYEREARAEERLNNLLAVAEDAEEVLAQLVLHPSAAEMRDRLEAAIAEAGGARSESEHNPVYVLYGRCPACGAMVTQKQVVVSWEGDLYGDGGGSWTWTVVGCSRCWEEAPRQASNRPSGHGQRDELGELGPRIRALRKERGWTLRDTAQRVADGSGISISLLSDVERGRALPSLSTLCALAQVFGTSPSQLLSDPPPPAAHFQLTCPACEGAGCPSCLGTGELCQIGSMDTVMQALLHALALWPGLALIEPDVWARAILGQGEEGGEDDDGASR